MLNWPRQTQQRLEVPAAAAAAAVPAASQKRQLCQLMTLALPRKQRAQPLRRCTGLRTLLWRRPPLLTEDLMFAIRRMSAAVRQQTSPALANGETAMPARVSSGPRSSQLARQGELHHCTSSLAALT